MQRHSRIALITGWMLLALCGCQRFGLNQNAALDEDIPYLSIPDPVSEPDDSSEAE